MKKRKSFDQVFARSADGKLITLVRMEVSPKSIAMWQFPKNKR